MKDVFKKYGLEPDTADFIGHAICLYRDDAYVFLLVLSTKGQSWDYYNIATADTSL